MILNELTRKQLRFLQKTNKDKKVFIKATVLLMLDNGCTAEFIAETSGIDESTIFRYKKGWLALDLNTYLESNYLPYTVKLTEEQDALLKTELRQNLYITSQEVVGYVSHSFGVFYTCEGMVKLLHRLGFVYKKKQEPFHAKQTRRSKLNS
jgi:transposase